jgi:hypothetical protein
MSGGKLKPKDPIPVPLRVGGTWDKPQVTGIDVGKLVAALLKSVAGGAVEDLQDRGVDAAKDVLGDLTKDDGKGDKKGKKDKKKKSDTDKAADAAKDAAKGLFGK